MNTSSHRSSLKGKQISDIRTKSREEFIKTNEAEEVCILKAAQRRVNHQRSGSSVKAILGKEFKNLSQASDVGIKMPLGSMFHLQRCQSQTERDNAALMEQGLGQCEFDCPIIAPNPFQSRESKSFEKRQNVISHKMKNIEKIKQLVQASRGLVLENQETGSVSKDNVVVLDVPSETTEFEPSLVPQQQQ